MQRGRSSKDQISVRRDPPVTSHHFLPYDALGRAPPLKSLDSVTSVVPLAPPSQSSQCVSEAPSVVYVDNLRDKSDVAEELEFPVPCFVPLSQNIGPGLCRLESEPDLYLECAWDCQAVGQGQAQGQCQCHKQEPRCVARHTLFKNDRRERPSARRRERERSSSFVSRSGSRLLLDSDKLGASHCQRRCLVVPKSRPARKGSRSQKVRFSTKVVTLRCRRPLYSPSSSEASESESDADDSEDDEDWHSAVLACLRAISR